MRWGKMRWRRLRETLYVFFLFWIFSFAYGDVVDLDKSVLLQFKSSVPDPSGFLSRWDSVGSTSDHYSWFGARLLRLQAEGSSAQYNRRWWKRRPQARRSSGKSNIVRSGYVFLFHFQLQPCFSSEYDQFDDN
uniref:Leucine-rich repeat-containing N-terminal plant-type domain-containing protein n=1 Tax=Nelumbo nucifera TaxID=4432 RepID=A0A822XUH8_NELNU|nr:TPA_asm: hypothetical protein HUJ06_024019 [Nelumbo nucifera]